MWQAKIKFLLLLLLIGMGTHAQKPIDRGFSAPQADSISKNDAGFEYMTSIDSLLRDRNRVEDWRDDQLDQSEKGSSFLSKVLESPAIQVLFWGLVIVLAAFILFRVFDFGGAIKRKSGKGEGEEETLQSFEWYGTKIAEAEANKTYRLALRYRFKQLLALLSDEAIINFLPEKTNHSYLQDIQDPDRKKLFGELLRIYEYVWYGRIEINHAQYESVKKLFTDIKKIRT